MQFQLLKQFNFICSFTLKTKIKNILYIHVILKDS